MVPIFFSSSDTYAPQVFLTNSVPPNTNNPKATFGWTSSEDSKFECKLDGRPVDCGSGFQGKYTTPELPDGNHMFSLNTVDSVGNKGTPVVIKWNTGTAIRPVVYH